MLRSLDLNPSIVAQTRELATQTSTLIERSSALAERSSVLFGVAQSEHHLAHGRIRVFPQVPSTVVRVTAGGGADTWGNWTVVVPINTVTMAYHAVGVRFEGAQGAGTFMLQFAKSATPTDAEILGEVRFRWGALANFFPVQIMPFLGAECAVNEGIWVRSIEDGAGGDWVDISLELTRHIHVEGGDLPQWLTWPW